MKGDSLKRVTLEEKEFIKQNCASMTDEQLAEYLKRDKKTIQHWRKTLGYRKTGGGKLNKITSPIAEKIPKKMTDSEKSKFFKLQLQNSLYYTNLQQQFTEFEINFYLEEWSSLCIQFEDVLATEIRQIDELIKIEIMANRLLKSIKLAEDEIDRLAKAIDELNKEQEEKENSDEEDSDVDANKQDDDFEKKYELLRSLIRTFSASSNAMSNDYQKVLMSKNNLLAELKARRKDRIEQANKPGSTFLDIVQQLRDEEVRKVQGRHMELVRIARDKKMDEWRKPHRFPDGKIDAILLDEDSDLLEETTEELENKENKENKENQQEIQEENTNESE